MAGLTQSLQVEGLPSDVEHDRLIDKLLIHFLRPSNGGGEVVSVTVSKGRPRSALVTFEDRKVALSVLSHHPHILELDGQRHELCVTLASPPPSNADKVILTMSVTVNCEQLPQGRRAMTSLQRRFPDLHIRFSSADEHCCSLSGPYSQVQPAVAHLLQLHESSRDGSSRSEQENGLVPTASQSEQTWRDLSGPPSLLPQQTLGSLAGREVENLGAEGGALALTLPESHLLGMQEELKCDAEVNDLFLIMDSDLFQYLRRCEEYKRILRDHNVEVVDETNQGLTTLFFQARSKVMAVSGRAESEVTGRTLRILVRAQKELRQLQQAQEASLRKDQVSKSALYPQGGLSKALDNIQNLLPKLLLNQDDDNVYIIGESSDVSQAKQLLVLGFHHGQEDVGASAPSSSHSPLQPLSSASSPSDAGQGERSDPRPPKEDARVGKMLRTSSGDRKMEYKLAARFKSSGVGGLGLGLGSRPGDFSDLKDQRDPDVQRNGTTFGHLGTSSASEDRALVRAAGLDFGALSVSPPERTGEDILFRSANLQPPAGAISITTSTRTPLTVPPPQTAFDLKTPSASGLPSGSATSLKRASSFSGRSRPKQEEEEKREPGAAAVPAPRSRPRSNSITSIVHSAEVTVPQLMWSHMKEAYCTRLDDMMSDLKMSESQSETDTCVKVVLKGAESSVVVSCQRELQKLVSMVTLDFSVMQLRLSDLGVGEGDEVFEACCVDLRARFRKVSQRIIGGTLYLIGPKLLCSQVDAALREVFSGGMRQNDPSHLFLKLGASSKVGLDHDLTLEGQLSSNSDTEKNTNRKTDLRKGDKLSSQPTESTLRAKCGNMTTLENIAGGLSQPVVKKELVVREKAERSGSTSGRKSKTYTSLSPSVDTNQGPAARWLDEKQDSLPVTLSKRQESVKHANLHCSPLMTCSICGDGSSQSLTACGLNLCAQCLSHHSHCKLCLKKVTERVLLDQKLQWTKGQDQASAGREREPGIRGTMNIVELHLSLAGHVRDTTAKITYHIPDGIQDEGHPFPGSPFKGGFFEAYLPLSAKGKSLLPCLKKAFQRGLTFTVSTGNTAPDRVTKVVWHNIPHKTKMEGGKSGNGYPDSNYLNRLSEALKAHGIEAVPAPVTLDKNKP
ncbi:hypothetical protein ACEWY4_002610 [Coilia grayii]|uniref:RING-type E3 ubiquitin transferase n=1 Tax=Coilia grayii TaxID=363190 RepID=A0ABD1KP07_9TELE